MTHDLDAKGLEAEQAMREKVQSAAGISGTNATAQSRPRLATHTGGRP
jgi:hypothetical protein